MLYTIEKLLKISNEVITREVKKAIVERQNAEDKNFIDEILYRTFIEDAPVQEKQEPQPQQENSKQEEIVEEKTVEKDESKTAFGNMKIYHKTKAGRKPKYTDEERVEINRQRALIAYEKRLLDQRLMAVAECKTGTDYCKYLKENPTEIYRLHGFIKRFSHAKSAVLKFFDLDAETPEEELIARQICKHMCQSPSEFGFSVADAEHGTLKTDEIAVLNFKPRRGPKN
ncbi:MAG: hypothetical protein MJZ34_13955 [Paludibacteraceae bacterium]|nr:hypothetical protein [Paludibacteraceae bacterium]